MASSTQQHPSPILFFETATAYQRSHALKAAVDLDLFTAIGEGNGTPQQIAARCSASERGIRILCDYLSVSGLLTKSDGDYSLTRDSTIFLDRRSPAYMGNALRFLHSDFELRAFHDLTEAVRKGGTALGGHGSMDPEHPIWVEFARSMASMSVMPAEFMARLIDAGAGERWKVLDIAAGHGRYGIAIAQQNPNAEIVAVDWRPVLAVAQENADRAGVGDRYRTIPGSAFEVDFGEGYDIVLLTNFLHHFEQATCEKLLAKIRRALKSGGRVVTLEFVPNEDRISPPMAASFALTMLSNTEAGDAYLHKELEAMFRNTGYASCDLHPVPGMPQSVLISVR
jgi:ubiquinone/menaquinone biosynthesis C-methylase UbiE